MALESLSDNPVPRSLRIVVTEGADARRGGWHDDMLPGCCYAACVKITYVAHTRFPTERAHGHQIANVCAAMAALGHDVLLLAPTVRTPISQDPFTYYGIPPLFSIRRMQSFDALHARFVPEYIAFFLSMFSYRRVLRRFFHRHRPDLFYIRSTAVLRAVLATDVPVVLELHTLPRRKSRSFVRACNRCTAVVCLTTPMHRELLAWGVLPERLLVEGDAADVRLFDGVKPRETVRRELGVPDDRFLIGYAGQLASMGLTKGLPELIRALALLHERDVLFHAAIAGGPEQARQQLQSLLSKELRDSVSFVGMLPRREVPSFLAACDVLVYPAPRSSHAFYNRDTSPLKIFEYMAADRPIVAADLPPVRDILDESTAVMVPPGDPSGLADGIEDVWRNSDAAKARARLARSTVLKHTWEERMRRILSFMEQ